MVAKNEKRLSEAALLTQAVENVFRRLIRILVGRITLVKLQEIMRYVYIDEAEKKLESESPGKTVAMTKMALITGLDTRTLIQVKKNWQEKDTQFAQKFLSELTPESAVVEAWVKQIEQTGNNRAGRTLSYGDNDSEFEKLAKNTISGRGITTQSIIKRLVDTKSVSQNKTDKSLTLKVDHFSPFLSDDTPNIINAAFTAISNLLSTIQFNLNNSLDERLFQRQAWTFRLEPARIPEFRLAMKSLLIQFEAKVIKEIAPWEADHYGKDLQTAGVGFYYFEDN